MSSERAYWLAWSQVPKIKPILLQRIAEHFGSLAKAWQASVEEISAVEGVGNNLLTTIAQTRSQLIPERLLEEHQRLNKHFWTPADSDYPNLLLETPGSPPLIYYLGKIRPEENQGCIPLIAIVGTRKPTEHGYRWTKKLSAFLAKCGFGIVAGMSTGIDGAAHQACLEVGGRAIAVLGTGVDVIYPQQQQQLYQAIKNTGLILSEYPAGTKPEKSNFPARNRLIAALCRAVLVIEAPEKSGALITARYANELGRDVYVLPNSPDVPQARGCLRLLSQGAHLILDEQELLLQLGTIPELDTPGLLPEKTPNLPPLNPELKQVLAAVTTQPTSFDLVVEKSNLTPGIVSASLLQLELLGLVTQLPGMRYQST